MGVLADELAQLVRADAETAVDLIRDAYRDEVPYDTGNLHRSLLLAISRRGGGGERGVRERLAARVAAANTLSAAANVTGVGQWVITVGVDDTRAVYGGWLDHAAAGETTDLAEAIRDRRNEAIRPNQSLKSILTVKAPAPKQPSKSLRKGASKKPSKKAEKKKRAVTGTGRRIEALEIGRGGIIGTEDVYIPTFFPVRRETLSSHRGWWSVRFRQRLSDILDALNVSV